MNACLGGCSHLEKRRSDARRWHDLDDHSGTETCLLQQRCAASLLEFTNSQAVKGVHFAYNALDVSQVPTLITAAFSATLKGWGLNCVWHVADMKGAACRRHERSGMSINASVLQLSKNDRDLGCSMPQPCAPLNRTKHRIRTEVPQSVLDSIPSLDWTLKRLTAGDKTLPWRQHRSYDAAGDVQYHSLQSVQAGFPNDE
jgi:hypothetical protein